VPPMIINHSNCLPLTNSALATFAVPANPVPLEHRRVQERHVMCRMSWNMAEKGAVLTLHAARAVETMLLNATRALVAKAEAIARQTLGAAGSDSVPANQSDRGRKEYCRLQQPNLTSC
jgi:hypothetical protein